MSDDSPTEDITPRTRYQMLPLRDVVVFPHMVLPLFVGREKSINALEEAVQSGKQIFLAAQHDAADDDPAPENISGIGTSPCSPPLPGCVTTLSLRWLVMITYVCR